MKSHRQILKGLQYNSVERGVQRPSHLDGIFAGGERQVEGDERGDRVMRAKSESRFSFWQSKRDGRNLEAARGRVRKWKGKRAVLLGREGVINRRIGCGIADDWSQFEFLPGALDGLRLLAAHGCQVLVISNAERRARGFLGGREQRELTQRMLLEVALAGGDIDKAYDCAAAARTAQMEYTDVLKLALEEHGLRAAETCVISDMLEEVRAAGTVGCPVILLRREAFLGEFAADSRAGQHVASNLREAAERVVRGGQRTLDELLRESATLDSDASDASLLWRGTLLNSYSGGRER
jgi:D-glycero-D-manno-heptose 1,7-bisphosphate phosphatase